MQQSSNQTQIPAPLWRRLAALVYDSFTLFSFLMLITAIALVINRGNSLLPYRWLYLTYLITTTGFLLTWLWHRGGQTLGMLAWKIKVVDQNNQQLSWRKAITRYGYALFSMGFFGLGLLWCLWDKDKQSLHDRLSGTRVIAK
jgi:uncharacterized RDD family membrane protein YckC